MASLIVGMLVIAGQARGQAPVALVEDVKGSPPGVEFMDYVSPGKVIQLGRNDAIVLGYMKSCWRETITGGIVTIGAEQSDVRDGKVDRVKVACDAGKMQLTAQQANKAGVMVFRDRPRPQITIYGRSPVVEIKGGGNLVIERLDKAGERYAVPIASAQLMQGAFYDLASISVVLAAGGTYRASLGTQQIVFRVDASAQPDRGPIIGRLLRFQPIN
ncbi:MAG: hypothetical protein AB7P50_08840 [Alphaproteobacteria bacterium]